MTERVGHGDAGGMDLETASASEISTPAAATTPRDVPLHVGLIPDGNRRWAARNGVGLQEAYDRAAQALDRATRRLVERGVRNVTVWPVSSRNWRRSISEIQTILDSVANYLRFAEAEYPARGWRFRIVGDMTRLRLVAPTLVTDLEAFERATANQTGATVVMVFDYGGRREIVEAIARIVQDGVDPRELTEEVVASHLASGFLPDVDLVFRAGGDQRLSGFLLFKAEYAESYFSDTLMPDLDEAEIDAVLDRYARRRYSQ